MEAHPEVSGVIGVGIAVRGDLEDEPAAAADNGQGDSVDVEP